jgi:hypothetical protein
MLEERRWRKWLYVTLVVFILWELAFSAIISLSYGEITSAAIPLAAGFLVILAIAIALAPRLLGDRLQPSLEFVQRVRIPLYAVYVGFVGMVVIMALPLGMRYVRYLNPSAFLFFRVASIGSIILIILLAAVFNRWHASLSLIEGQGQE